LSIREKIGILVKERKKDTEKHGKEISLIKQLRLVGGLKS